MGRCASSAPPRALAIPSDVTLSAIKAVVRGSPRAVGARGRGLLECGERDGLWVVGTSAMFYSGLLTEGGRKETDMREAASLRQQRRMKQAVQFIHKDSADLLPLDGLKKLGSSKDTVSPRGRARLGIPARGGQSPSLCGLPGPAHCGFHLVTARAPALCGPLARYCSVSIPLHPAFSCFSLAGFRRSFSSSRCVRLCLLPSCLSALDSALPSCPQVAFSYHLFILSTKFDLMGLEPSSQGSHTGCVAGPMTQTEVTPNGCE